MFGKLKPEQYKVIVNGVDQRIYPSAAKGIMGPWRLIIR